MRKVLFCLFVCLFKTVNTPAQEIVRSPAEQILPGIWENGGRFVEFYGGAESSGVDRLRIVLKPFYRFVYDAPVSFTASLKSSPQSADGVFVGILNLKYPNEKKIFSQPLFVMPEYLFTSFYERVPFEKEYAGSADGLDGAGNSAVVPSPDGAANAVRVIPEDNERGPLTDSSVLHGFWVEQGSKDGILLYPCNPAESFNAYFFYGGRYIKFRYRQGASVYSEKKASFTAEDGGRYLVPKMFVRDGLVYSCITNAGSVLRNYETGSYGIEKSTGARTERLLLTIVKDGAGPGKNAAAATLPDYVYMFKENAAFYLAPQAGVFALGAPFLVRSSITNLEEEIDAHNKKRKKPREPDIADDDFDYNWEEARRLQKLN